MSNHEDLIKLIAVLAALLIAFPAIGIVFIESIIIGVIIGISIVVIIGFLLWFFWYNR